MSDYNIRLAGGGLLGIGCGISIWCLSINSLQKKYNINVYKYLSFNCLLGGLSGFFITKNTLIKH
jgi:hypothetical protein